MQPTQPTQKRKRRSYRYQKFDGLGRRPGEWNRKRRAWLVEQWLWVERTEEVHPAEFAKAWGLRGEQLTAWVREFTGRRPLRIAESSYREPHARASHKQREIHKQRMRAMRAETIKRPAKVRVSMWAYLAKGQRMDRDNLRQGVFDALERAHVIENDSQIVDDPLTIGRDWSEPRVEVGVEVVE